MIVVFGTLSAHMINVKMDIGQLKTRVMKLEPRISHQIKEMERNQ